MQRLEAHTDGDSLMQEQIFPCPLAQKEMRRAGVAGLDWLLGQAGG